MVLTSCKQKPPSQTVNVMRLAYIISYIISVVIQVSNESCKLAQHVKVLISLDRV